MDTKLKDLLISFANACNLAKVGDSIPNMAEFIAIEARITDMLTEATQRGVQAERDRQQERAASASVRVNELYGKFGGTPGPKGSHCKTTLILDGYRTLHAVLIEALDQAQHGKGAERHNLGGDTPFERQRMQTVSELVGSPDGMVYQAIKKLTEGMKLPTHERQIAELLGAINYIAGIIIFLRKQEHDAECRKMEDALNNRPHIPQPQTGR